MELIWKSNVKSGRKNQISDREKVKSWSSKQEISKGTREVREEQSSTKRGFT